MYVIQMNVKTTISTDFEIKHREQIQKNIVL